MKRSVLSLLLAAFCVGLVYAGGHRLYAWYETGQLAMHREMINAPADVSWAFDPVLFMGEFALNIFFVVMGLLGIGSACEDLSCQYRRID
jgi:hypothetical protein